MVVVGALLGPEGTGSFCRSWFAVACGWGWLSLFRAVPGLTSLVASGSRWELGVAGSGGVGVGWLRVVV